MLQCFAPWPPQTPAECFFPCRQTPRANTDHIRRPSQTRYRLDPHHLGLRTPSGSCPLCCRPSRANHSSRHSHQDQIFHIPIPAPSVVRSARRVVQRKVIHHQESISANKSDIIDRAGIGTFCIHGEGKHGMPIQSDPHHAGGSIHFHLHFQKNPRIHRHRSRSSIPAYSPAQVSRGDATVHPCPRPQVKLTRSDLKCFDRSLDALV